MKKEGPTSHIKAYDITLDLLELFKDEIVAHAQNNDVLEVDLIIYLFTRCIKIYGKYRNELNHEYFDQRISDYLIEIMDESKVLSFTDSTSFLSDPSGNSRIKSKQCETIYIVIEVLNSLLCFKDEKATDLLQRTNRKDKNRTLSKTTENKDVKDIKIRMRTKIIFNFLERLSHRRTHDNNFDVTESLVTAIEKFIHYFMENRGSIIVDKSLDKSIVCEEEEDQNALLKVQNREQFYT